MFRMRAGFVRWTIVAGLMGITVLPAMALGPVWDLCNQSTNSQGNSCPNPDDYLFRPKYTDGTCGDWMCCPKNDLTPEQIAQGGQTYNCNNATKPTRISVSLVNKVVLGGLVMTSTKPPSTTTTTRTTTSGTLSR